MKSDSEGAGDRTVEARSTRRKRREMGPSGDLQETAAARHLVASSFGEATCLSYSFVKEPNGLLCSRGFLALA
jgi:hypothetical protein